MASGPARIGVRDDNGSGLKFGHARNDQVHYARTGRETASSLRRWTPSEATATSPIALVNAQHLDAATIWVNPYLSQRV
jgi:hypothetical protein